jgi:hypothetical protein
MIGETEIMSGHPKKAITRLNHLHELLSSLIENEDNILVEKK